MAEVTDLKCTGCGLELTDDGRAFIWDDKTKATKDFLILMSTCHLLYGAKISGRLSETYCSDCDRYVKIYIIKEAVEGIADPCEVVRQGIKRQTDECKAKIERLKDIRERSEYVVEKNEDYYLVSIPEYEGFRYSNYLFPEMTKEEVIRNAINTFHEEIDGEIEYLKKRYRSYVESHYLILDERDLGETDIREKVKCPECGSEIRKYVSAGQPCPRCGGLLFGFPVCYD